jgi:Immunity protein 49
LPKALASRSNDEGGFTEDLISTPAFIYAKIAWRHGYEVVVDSPFVPSEWLPISPLDRYENHYAFLE